MSSSAYLERVRSQLEADGWNTTTTELRQGTSLVAGSRPTVDGTERVLAMVVTDPEPRVESEHVEYLHDAREQKGADGAFLTATVEYSETSRAAANDHDIDILDADAATGQQATDEDAGSARPTDTPQGRSAGGNTHQQSPAQSRQQPGGSDRPRDQRPAGSRPSRQRQSVGQHAQQQGHHVEQNTQQQGQPVQAPPQQQAHARSRTDRVRGLSTTTLVRGGIYGACAYVVGFALVGLLSAIDDITVPDSGPSQQTVIGWLFYGSHNVDLDGSSGTASTSLNIFEDNVVGLTSLTETVPEVVYLLVPVVVLCGTGYLLYDNAADATRAGPTAAAMGASLVAGYLPLVAAGTVIFEYSEQQGGVTTSVAPEFATGLLLAGLFYPVLCGALGALGAQYRSRPGRGSQRQ